MSTVKERDSAHLEASVFVNLELSSSSVALTPRKMSLDLLPTELQCSIVRLLEPISLISISQTNTHFRHLVNPQKKHFVERLLALESLVDYGGETLVFRSRDNQLTPNWMDERWDAMRWACTDCLRLLPHRCFDNHSILRLRYRKPIPGSPAADLVTTWEPVESSSSSRIRRQKLPFKDSFTSEKRLRRRYLFSVTSEEFFFFSPGGHSLRSTMLEKYQECGMAGFEELSPHQFGELTPQKMLQMMDDNALAVELERCGNKRRFRRCNECRYLGGQLEPGLNNEHYGTLQVPIVKSRQIMFGSMIERYFPGIWDYLLADQHLSKEPLFRIRRRAQHQQPWAMYMVRCPRCAGWKELREFRIGGTFHLWAPILIPNSQRAYMNWDDREMSESLLDESRCNACVAKIHDRNVLGQMLLSWITRLIDLWLMGCTRYLKHGWSNTKSVMKDMPREYQHEIEHLIETTPCLQQDDREHIATEADVALLRLRLEQWMSFWDRMKLSTVYDWGLDNLGMAHVDNTNVSWKRNFDETEAEWRELTTLKNGIKQRPEALAEWALSRDAGKFT
ncbi:hypothetical protein B0T10DRAFT_490523 [Thelonectria olida]|uniref:F-box domain-containing protein n=1 Tax=Thelonectria olida TaxID=1576542 RepID=A0A9P9AKA5_9HYPO|nr:hypothetical protein B0T10DRAFT_490523 [Thelonectria olida]